MNRFMAMIGIAAAALVVAAAPSGARAQLTLGLLPHMSASELVSQYTPLADYLSRETGEKVTLLVPKDYDTFKALVREGKIDFALSNPVVYLQLKQTTAVAPLALIAAPGVGTKFRGILIARKDGGIDSIRDVKGKKVVFVDASAGYRRLEDTAQPTDQLIEARLQVRWLYRKLEVSPTLEFFERQRGDTTTTEYRAILRTTRRF